MKQYIIVKLPSSDKAPEPLSKRELPVIFKDKARAELRCRSLNLNKPVEIKEYVVEERESDAS
jgi:hypothetical protein